MSKSSQKTFNGFVVYNLTMNGSGRKTNTKTYPFVMLQPCLTYDFILKLLSKSSSVKVKGRVRVVLLAGNGDIIWSRFFLYKEYTLQLWRTLLIVTV